MNDAYHRRVNYLRISVTDRCNLRCSYCTAAEPFQLKTHDEILRLEEIARLARLAVAQGIEHIRLTGGEPLVRKGLLGLVRELAGIPGLADLSLTTNGVLLAPLAADLRQAGLRRVNISLDSLDPARFAAITGGGAIDPVLAGIDTALAVGLAPVKINAVVHDHTLGELPAFARLLREKPLHVRFIARMNLGQYRNDRASAEWTEQLRAAVLALGFEPRTATIGHGPAVPYRHADYAGSFGIISSTVGHACERCNRLRLTADGRIKPCLFSGETVPVFALLRRQAPDEAIVAGLERALAIKPRCGAQPTQQETQTMREIGG